MAHFMRAAGPRATESRFSWVGCMVLGRAATSTRLVRFAPKDALVGTTERAKATFDPADQPIGGACLPQARAAADGAVDADLGEHAIESGGRWACVRGRRAAG